MNHDLFDDENLSRPSRNLWPVQSESMDGRLKRFVIHKEGRNWIDLDNPEVQSLLCLRLRAVKVPEDVPKWKGTFGTLWPGTFKILELASTLRWIYKFHDLLAFEQTPLLRKYFCAESALGRAMANITEEEYDDIASQMVANEVVSSDDLFRLVNVLVNQDRPEKGFILFTPDANFTTNVHHLSVGFGGIGGAIVTDIFKHSLEVQVNNIEAVKNDDAALLAAGYKYFEVLVGQQVECLQLSVSAVKTETGKRLQQTFSARYPWQAILSAMLKDVTGSQSPRKCANPSCDQFFVPKRSDKQFCPRPGCRKAASRKRTAESQKNN